MDVVASDTPTHSSCSATELLNGKDLRSTITAPVTLTQSRLVLYALIPPAQEATTITATSTKLDLSRQDITDMCEVS